MLGRSVVKFIPFGGDRLSRFRRVVLNHSVSRTVPCAVRKPRTEVDYHEDTGAIRILLTTVKLGALRGRPRRKASEQAQGVGEKEGVFDEEVMSELKLRPPEKPRMPT